jgi:hypothetical protein
MKHYSTGKLTTDLGELMVTAARVGGGEPTVGGARGEGLKATTHGGEGKNQQHGRREATVKQQIRGSR